MKRNTQSLIIVASSTVLLLTLGLTVSCQTKPPPGPMGHLPSNVPEDSVAPSTDWSYTISDPVLIPNSLNVPVYRWYPDGHIAVLPDEAGNWMMFWSEFENYRSTGASPYPEDQTTLSPKYVVFGGRGGDGWDNGGSWLNSVFRISETQLVGFYHAEDHWVPRNPDGIAWKSIGVTYSTDNGKSWEPGEQIITAWEAKPTDPEWGGAGDHSVVWDEREQRWVCFYQEQVESNEAQIHMAVSSDLSGAPGTWYKWDGSDFSAPGLGGKGAPLTAFFGKEGANPSVHWNTYLGSWIMVYGGWDGITYISASTDMLNWEPPRELVRSDQDGRAWYPTIIGEYGDTLGGQNVRLYYADIAGDFSSRKFYMRDITFLRND